MVGAVHQADVDVGRLQVGRGGEGRREELNLQRTEFQPGQHRPSGDALPTAADARLRQRTGKALVHEVIGGGGGGGGGGAALGDNTVQQAVVVGVRRAGVRLGVVKLAALVPGEVVRRLDVLILKKRKEEK